MRSHRQRRKYELHLMLGRVCARCGHSNPDSLQIDHVFNDGAEERRLFPNYDEYLQFLMLHAASGRYQLLCANCNQEKEAVRRRAFAKKRRREVALAE